MSCSCMGDMAEEAFGQPRVTATLAKWNKTHYLANNVFSFTAKARDATRENWERIFVVGPKGAIEGHD
jgi:hypothetical protein